VLTIYNNSCLCQQPIAVHLISFQYPVTISLLHSTASFIIPQITIGLYTSLCLSLTISVIESISGWLSYL